MAKLGHGIVRQFIAEGVVDLTTPPEVMAKLGQGIARQGLTESVANLITLHPGSAHGVHHSEARYL